MNANQAKMLHSAAMMESATSTSIRPDRDMSPIEVAVHRLNSSMSILHTRLIDLRRRLEPVSAPQEPEKACGNGIGAAPQALPKAPLEEQLYSLAEGIESANSQLSNMMAYLHI